MFGLAKEIFVAAFVPRRLYYEIAILILAVKKVMARQAERSPEEAWTVSRPDVRETDAIKHCAAEFIDCLTEPGLH